MFIDILFGKINESRSSLGCVGRAGGTVLGIKEALGEK